MLNWSNYFIQTFQTIHCWDRSSDINHHWMFWVSPSW